MIPLNHFLNVKQACRTTGKRTKDTPTAEVVRQILCGLGLNAERTRRDTDGTVGLFRDLLSPPPWEEVQIDDVLGALSPERAEELTPLYRIRESESVLVEHYRQVQLARSRTAQFLKIPLPEVIDTVEPLTLQWRLERFVTQLSNTASPSLACRDMSRSTFKGRCAASSRPK
jgi:hypothetical protein